MKSNHNFQIFIYSGEIFDAITKAYTTITKSPEVIINKFSVSVSVPFLLFPCSIRGKWLEPTYQDII